MKARFTTPSGKAFTQGKKKSPARKRSRLKLADRPSYWLRPRLFRDGRYWCALYGDNMQDGVAGFGDTPDEAFAQFDRFWFTHRGPSAFRGKTKK
jgi:hypothetical protein